MPENGRRATESNTPARLGEAERSVGERLQHVAWFAVALFVATFLLVDVVLIAVLDDPIMRLSMRWLLIGGTCVAITFTFSRRAIKSVTSSMHGERLARNEAEALAELAASIATGNSIHETLTTAASCAARLFGGSVRCTVSLPEADGGLRAVAWSHATSAAIAAFSFQPGEGYNGRAYSEGRLIRIDDIHTEPGPRAEVSRGTDVRTMMVAPLIADQRTLGIITAVSPTPNAFGEHQERVLSAVARHVAVALVAAEAREVAQGEAAKKSAIIDQMADAVLVADRNRTIQECNQAAASLFDMPADKLIGLTGGTVPWRMCDADGVELGAGRGPLSRASTGESVVGEYRILTHTGHERWVSANATPLRSADGEVTGAIMVMRDVADWRNAQAALRESEERYRQLVELCPDPIIVHCEGVVAYANPATLVMAGIYREEDIVGHPLLEFVHPDFQESMVERTRSAIELNESSGMAEITLQRPDGELIQIEATTMPVSYQGRPAIQAVLRDVTERKRAEAALAHQALHDALTALPNRVLLLDRLQQAIATAQRDGGGLSLLLMDLDRFKEVNDTLGHHAGDLLLQQVGTRLRGALRQADTIARLGGDEFAVILPRTDAAGVVTVVESLLRRLQAPFAVEGQPVVVGASIGVALSPEHGVEADTLMRRADVAMYVAKRSSTGFSIYQAEQDRNSPDRLSLIGELRRAIDEGELVLHYQPKFDLRSGEMAGVEALVRWEHPLRGLLGPDQFIPIAEQAGLIEPLSRWVLRAALVQASAWRRIGLEVPVAVNLSMRSLYDEQLPDKIAALLRSARTPANLLVLEITESTLMIDPMRTLGILERLRAMGIRVAIDDFGTGHSSLAYLKRLPADEVKIDRSFVKDIPSDETDRLIVRATVDLAHGLGLRVIAEGVQDELTRTMLAELGCDEAQGFYLGRPMRGHDLTQWLFDQPIAA